MTGVCSSSSAHRRFQEWEQAGVFHEIWRQGLLEYDSVVGIDWAWLAADGAMSKAPLGGPRTGPNPIDRAKKGRNVRFSARRQGSRSGWHTTAPTGKTSPSSPTLSSIPIERPKPTAKRPQRLGLDRGYDAPSMHRLAREHCYVPHIRARGEEIRLKASTPGWKARRWVVEATHSWLNRNRGILIRWSKKEENHLALLQLACGLIAFKKANIALQAAQPGWALNVPSIRRLDG